MLLRNFSELWFLFIHYGSLSSMKLVTIHISSSIPGLFMDANRV